PRRTQRARLARAGGDLLRPHARPVRAAARPLHRSTRGVRRLSAGSRLGRGGALHHRDHRVVRYPPVRRPGRRSHRRRARARDGGRAAHEQLHRAMTRVWIVAGVVVVFHLATASIYGYHRDEFYYLAQGRRLAWGYVDNPPLTPLLYRIDSKLFGTSRLGLSVMPALLHGTLVVVTALVAGELGGNNRAQFLAALGAAIGAGFVTTGHFLGTVTPEIVLGAAASLFVVRVLCSGVPRWWIAVGIVIGVG